MKIRTTKPSNNKFYIRKVNGGYSLCIKGKPTDPNANVLSNCVGYACGRFNEIIGKMKYPELNCNAENFIERAKSIGLKISNKPVLGGIMVWQKGSTLSGNDGVGHVAVVERIDNDNQIYTSESAYGGRAFYNVTRKNTNGRWGAGSAYKFRGCIINPAIEEPEKKKFKKYYIRVTANVLNVREGAGTNYKVVKTIKKGEKWLIRDEKNGWGKIRIGWIKLSYTKKV